ncbi:MAG: hypothetical protein J6V00_05195 [Bacteroidaceae bacterium]|nr:hypothetical protein [Bacteroidaceae bacterium]
MSRKDKMLERMQAKYPESNFEDEEVLYGRISDDLDELDEELSSMREREKSFVDMFTGNPRSAEFLMAWKKGGDPMVELVRAYGTDGLKEMIDDPAKLDEVAEANKEYLARVAKSRELEEEYKANLAKSMEDIAAIEGDDAKIDEAVEWLMRIGRDAIMGVVNPKDVQIAMKALAYDTDVETAAIEGEVRGRNAKIDEKLRKASGGDGTARLGGSGRIATSQRAPQSIFDLAAEAR